VRPVSEEMYGLSREYVIGSATTLEYRDGDIYRTRGIEQPIDDGPGKPVHVWTRTGQKPLIAGGNADREFAYDTGAEHALAQAAQRGWTIVSMKNDFATVF
jgi:hypothetical protein